MSKGFIARRLGDNLREAARSYPVITLTGPRQSGKTTLARATFGDHAYVSLEDPHQRSFALTDPQGFLRQFSGPVIIDEVQRAPEIFSYIQGIVDDLDRAGHFILTGSQNFLLLKGVSQSLAGRVSVRHLLPLSLAELDGRQGVDPECLGDEPDAALVTSKKRDLFEVLFTGFFPRIYKHGLDPQDCLGNYLQTYLDRDVRDLLNVGDLHTFELFMQLCAARSGSLLNLSSIANDCGASQPTIRRWLSVLETSFVIARLQPHHRNFSKRLVKSPKLYFLDSGLLCFLLRIGSAEELRTHAMRGAVFETFVVSELLKRQLHRGRRSNLYFWRDRSGHEVDLLLDQGTTLRPVEIKSSQTVSDSLFKGLRHFRRLAGNAAGPLSLICGDEGNYIRSDVRVYGWQDF